MKLPSFLKFPPRRYQAKSILQPTGFLQRSCFVASSNVYPSFLVTFGSDTSTRTECQKVSMTQLSFAFLCLCPSVTFLKWCHLLQPVWASNVSYESRNSCWPSRWALKGDHWSRVLERRKHGVETPRAALYLFTWLIMSFIQASFISVHLLVDIQPKPLGPTWSQVTKIAAIAFTTWTWALSVLTQRPIPLE